MAQNQFNPLADIADILGSIARNLFPPSSSQPPSQSRSQDSIDGGHWVDVRDPLVVKSMKSDAEERKRRRLMPLVYE